MSKELNIIEDNNLSLTGVVDSMEVKDEGSYNYACKVLIDIVTAKKAVEEALGPQVKAAYQAHQTALAQKKKYSSPLEALEVRVKGKISKYEIEVEEQRKKIAESTSAVDAHETLSHMTLEVAPVVNKVSGVNTRPSVDIEILDSRAFLKAIIEGTVGIRLDSVITIKPGAIKEYIKLTGCDSIPGIRIERTKIASVTVPK